MSDSASFMPHANTRGYCFANTLNESYDLSQELLIKVK
jgi:hypothetical protein